VVPVVGQIEPSQISALLEQLLEAVAQRGARYAILDLTAVEVIDTATAQLLHRVVMALRLLGTEGLISGIRPSVAQALVGLGVDLTRVSTVASLHAALRRCMSEGAGAASSPLARSPR
jgi:rsbT co-antagonist protein RsbR